MFNKFGHVAIISEVNDSQIEIIQQNPRPFSPSREHFKMKLENENGK
ncbi:CHAP domain-containing protein [Chryseobacterium indoltheticum]